MALHRVFKIAAAGSALVLLSASVPSESVECATPGFTVVAAHRDEIESVCQAVAETVAFMEALGLRATRPHTTIRLVQALAQTHYASSLGAFDRAHDRIELLTYEAARQLLPDRPAFGVPMGRELYRSFIVHEIAHAVANPNFARPPVTAAHEYIAYSVQLATMPAGLRAAVLHNVPTEGFAHPKEVGEMLLALDPNRFAVKSYLHFVRPENGAVAFEQLLTGNF